MKVRFYLDTRSNSINAPLKIAISHNSKTAYIGLDIYLSKEQFNPKTERVQYHDNKDEINSFITRRKLEIENIGLDLKREKRLAMMSVYELKRFIENKLDNINHDKGLFYSQFLAFIELKERAATKAIYKFTLSRLSKFYPDIRNLKFENITTDFLLRFENFLSWSEKTNSISIHLRNIRAVFNYAIANDVTSFYPFKKFHIKTAPTKKRSLTVEQLRDIFTMPVEPYLEYYRDLFKLIFLLIGINIVDLIHLKSLSADGRIEFERAKTGRHYSIKVEPEAMEIINRYRGKEYLLDVLEHCSYLNFRKRLNFNLKRFGDVNILRQGKKVLNRKYPYLSTYWARHSWATIASQLDIPRDVIAHALGHGTNTVTDLYIDFDLKKVDAANRKIIDFVLYNKV